MEEEFGSWQLQEKSGDSNAWKEAMRDPRTDKGVKKIARWTREKIWKFSSKDTGRYNPGKYNFLQVLSTKNQEEKKNVCVYANIYIYRRYTERYGKI